jgi:hypothetical protein
MRVRMTKDGTTYSGQYKSGDELDLNDRVAAALIDSGSAEALDPAELDAYDQQFRRAEKNKEEKITTASLTNPEGIEAQREGLSGEEKTATQVPSATEKRLENQSPEGSKQTTVHVAQPKQPRKE